MGLSALLVIAGILALVVVARGGVSDWRTASRAPVGLAPDPATTPEAVVQVYAARAVRWRGYFGVHTWVAVKPAGAGAYTVYEVIGWRLRYSDSALVIRQRGPDERWFGAEPELLADAYRSCLRLADELGARSVAFPAISMGIYGYPTADGARVALRTVSEHLAGGAGPELVRFVLFSDETYGHFADALADLT